MLSVPGEGDSNVCTADIIGLESVPRSAFDYPNQAPGEPDQGDGVRDAGFTFGGEIVDFRWGNFTVSIKNAAEFWDNSCGHRDIVIDSS